jgi:hypothetical protein
MRRASHPYSSRSALTRTFLGLLAAFARSGGEVGGGDVFE